MMKMPIIRPITDLRNNFTEISKIIHDNHQPIFFTKNGYGDMVAMSVEVYEDMRSRLLIGNRLMQAATEATVGESLDFDETVSRMRDKLNGSL